MPRRLRREDYTVGWVCALPVELAVAQEMLDEEHDTIPSDAHDTNIYSCGCVGEHNVVIACLPFGQTGTGSAAIVATQMQSAFSNIRFGLMVGIGGGVPSKEADIRLGDVVVSSPHRTHGGVVQYDFGKTTPNGFERTGSLNAPPAILLNAVSVLQAKHMRRKGTLQEHLHRIETLPGFGRDEAGPDDLFQAPYDHAEGRTCNECDTTYLVRRATRAQEVNVHYGIVASGNQVMRSASERDRVSSVLGGGVLCFEMEAAGLMNKWPCLVIRGICDYADSHKNKRWQPYAAGAAAAYAKELLLVIPAAEMMEARRAEDAIRDTNKRCRESPPRDHDPIKRRKPDGSDNKEPYSAEQRNFPNATLLSEEQKRRLTESLAFDQLDARQMTIKTAHARTCKWLLKHESYVQWIDATQLEHHHGFLWIKGKAGAGKSTLMKFAMLNARRSMEDFVVVSFFFNARGEAIEKSTIGAYRSLLWQLLKYFPSLQNNFDSLGLLNPDAVHEWTLESLQTLLEQAIRSLGRSSVVCFIDALDECEEDQVRDMVQFFETIGEVALSGKVRFQVCLSSRHYPHITIQHGLDLLLEGQEGHKQDISNYVESELRIGGSKNAQQIRADLQEKASGVFMWVVLVVGILNKEANRGQARKLRQKLHEIPGDLYELFRDILTRDSHNREELVLCIQWVLFAKMPLSPEQLYYGILSGIEGEVVTQWDPEETTQDTIQRFILDSSKGLAEITASKHKTVQFIHESVRDFLLKEDGLGKIWPEYACNFHGQSHESLKQCCLKYMSIDVDGPLYSPRASSKREGALHELATQAFPFLDYAVRHVLFHANAAEGNGISQAEFLGSFPTPDWVHCSNLLEKHNVRRHTNDVSLLYILSEFDMANLVRVIYPTSDCIELENERYGCPLFAAAAMNSTNVLRILLTSSNTQYASTYPDASGCEGQHQATRNRRRGRTFAYSKSRDFLWNAMDFKHDGVLALCIESRRFDVNSRSQDGCTLLEMALHESMILSVWSLLNSEALIVDNLLGRSMLYGAAERGDNDLVEAFVGKVTDVNARAPHGTALDAALAKNHEETAILLIERGADVNASGEYDCNPLHTAIMAGHVKLASLLLDKGADINAPNVKHGYALQTAISQGSTEITALLLERGANINAQGGYYGNPLQAAIAGGFEEIALLLLKRGADPHAAGGYYGSALQAASAKGYKDVASMLLRRSVDVNASLGCYGTALWAASYVGNIELAQLLLENGANVNAHYGSCGTALHAASYTGNRELVKSLLDSGADIHGQSQYYGSALQTASYTGKTEVVQLLLDCNADAHGQGGHCGNALQAAAAQGRIEVVQLLLDHGVDVNAQGGYYGSAIQAASDRSSDHNFLKEPQQMACLSGFPSPSLPCWGNTEIVRLLIDRGADVNAKGGRYGNAMQAALQDSVGNEEVIKLLEQAGASRTPAR